MKNALRTGLENMGFRFPNFNFNSPTTFLGHNKKVLTIYHYRGTKKLINHRHGTDRRN